ncbi:MAG: Asp-tRNA(Asn)/Glu-tRNA(Gln) amidotransferase subunit GatB, partial [Candidatus Hydrothermia bacterium]|nr:Asp-tRNA(Asn)/Glu-tRNA(Gln) amidotransferase subunit GatB [Candidatus Hydrothermia bacterium]
LDFNRSGIPLLEVFTEPCIESPAEAKAFLEKFRDYIRFLKISDCNMERGELRVDSNISVSRDPSELGVKVELKNLNSFKAVNEALNYEIERQIRTLKHGGKIVRETRLWDEYKGESRPMRKKEESMDYRYFPEPDLPVVILNDEFIEDIKRNMPELPDTKFERYVRIYGLSTEQARLIAFDRELSEIFDSVSKKTKDQKTVANWLTVVIPGYMRENQSITDINCEDLVRLEQSLTSGFITHNQAKEILARFFEKEIPIPISLTEFEHLQSSVTDEMLEKVVDEVLAEQKDLVEKYLSGKTSVLQAILGQCMRKLKGLGDPIKLKEILERKLK